MMHLYLIVMDRDLHSLRVRVDGENRIAIAVTTRSRVSEIQLIASQ